MATLRGAPVGLGLVSTGRLGNCRSLLASSPSHVLPPRRSNQQAGSAEPSLARELVGWL
jgi:hypothetical protein